MPLTYIQNLRKLITVKILVKKLLLSITTHINTNNIPCIHACELWHISEGSHNKYQMIRYQNEIITYYYGWLYLIIQC